MAFCPKCRQPIDAMAIICPHCGHDFSRRSPPGVERKGLAYSNLANLALVVGQLAAALGVIVAIVIWIFAAINGEWLQALFTGPITTLLMLALLVVFARVMDLN